MLSRLVPLGNSPLEINPDKSLFDYHNLPSNYIAFWCYSFLIRGRYSVKKHEDMNEKLKAALGFSEDQLLAEFNAAEKQWKASPELQEELKAPEGEFEKILEMARTRKEEQEVKRNFCTRVKNWVTKLFN